MALAVLSIADGGPRTPQPGYLSREKVFKKETSLISGPQPGYLTREKLFKKETSLKIGTTMRFRKI